MNLKHRLLIGLSIVLVSGYTWSLDMPIAIEVPLREEPYSFSTLQINLLFTFNYLAIFVTDIPIGIALDKFPLQKAVILIGLLSLLSELLINIMFALQPSGYKYFIYFGRALFGVTGEAFFTVQAILISEYAGKRYDLLMGFGMCAPFFFDSVNNFATPFIYDKTHSLPFVWSIGTFFCFICFLASLWISFVLSKEHKQKTIKSESESVLLHQSLSLIESEEGQPQPTGQQQQEFSISRVKNLPRKFWVLAGAVFWGEYCLDSFLQNLNDTLVRRFQIPYVVAGYLLFIPFGIAVFLSLIVGQLVNKKQYFRRTAILVSSVSYFIAVGLLYLIPNVSDDSQPLFSHYLIVILTLLTMAFGISVLYTCTCSGLKYVVDKKYIGTAWGVVGSAIGLSSGTGPLTDTILIDSAATLAEGYRNLTLYTFVTSAIPIGFALWIYFGQFDCLDVSVRPKTETQTQPKESPQISA